MKTPPQLKADVVEDKTKTKKKIYLTTRSEKGDSWQRKENGSKTEDPSHYSDTCKYYGNTLTGISSLKSGQIYVRESSVLQIEDLLPKKPAQTMKEYPISTEEPITRCSDLETSVDFLKNGNTNTLKDMTISCFGDNSRSCLSVRKQNSSAEKSVDNSSSFVARPPLGYFIRKDLSTEESASDQKNIDYSSEHQDLSDDIPPCTFGYKNWVETCLRNKPKESNALASNYRQANNKNARNKKNSLKKKITKVKVKKQPRSKSVENEISSTFNNNVEEHNVALKKEWNSTMLYKQKLISPKSSKFYQTVRSLPVSPDSVLYYYEPQGKLEGRRSKSKIKNKKLYNQNKHDHKIIHKAKGNCRNERSKQSVVVWKKLIDNNGNVYLNTNANANTSDIDLPKLEGVKTKEMPGVIPNAKSEVSLTDGTFPQLHNESIQNISMCTLGANEHSKAGSKCVDSIYQMNDLEEAAATDKLQPSPFLEAKESYKDRCNIDLMVDDFIQSALKKEAEYERRLITDNPGETMKQNESEVEKTGKNGTFFISLANKHIEALSKKPTTKDHENDRVHERINSKSNTMRPELAKLTHVRNRISISSPNISVGDRKQMSNISNLTESPSRSKSQPQTNKSNISSALGFKYSQNYQKTDSTASKIGMIGSETIISSETNDILQKSEKRGLTENILELERGRGKKTYENSPFSFTKANVMSKPKKRTQSQPLKPLSKKKIGLKKSHSMSPCPAWNRGGTSQLRQDNGEYSSNSLLLHKLGKKHKKKVRIVVDLNGFSGDKHKVTTPHSREINDTAIQTDQDVPDEIMEKMETKTQKQLSSEQYRQDNKWDQEINEENEPESHIEEEQENTMRHIEVKEEPITPKCRFAEVHKYHEATLSKTCAVNETVETKSKVKKSANPKKMRKIKNESTRCWDNSWHVQKEDLKPKDTFKRKRYQLKRTIDAKPEKLKNTVNDNIECDHNEEKEKKCVSPTNAKALKSTSTKKLNCSPKMQRKITVDPNQSDNVSVKGADETDLKEGSSVDAPSFNARRESVLRISKSGPIVNTGIQSLRETLGNTRVKLARDSIAKTSKTKPNLQQSPTCLGTKLHQPSPITSRSTDLDIAFGTKRQLSPSCRGVVGLGRPSHRESKLSVGKLRVKSEREDLKSEQESPIVHTGRLNNINESMDMNIINLALSWMVQGVINRFPFFNQKPKNEVAPSSPVVDVNLPDIVENESF